MSSDPDHYDPTADVDTDDDRVEGHTFHGGYEAHDIAEAHVTRHLEHMGFAVEPWGIDMREDNSVIGDDKMDLKLHDPSAVPSDRVEEAQPPGSEPNPALLERNLVGVMEVKTKRSEDWYGIVNRHHLRKYLVQAHEHDVPAYIYMSLLNENEERIANDTFIPVEPWSEYEDVLNGAYTFYEPSGADQFLRDNIDRHPQVTRTFRAPDGQQVVKLDVDTGVDWPTLTSQLKPTKHL